MKRTTRASAAPCHALLTAVYDVLRSCLYGSVLMLAGASFASAQITLTEGTNLSADISPANKQFSMDLLGSIWLLPQHGGEAEKITENLQPAERPRWSPDGNTILYQTRSALGSQIWMHDLAARSSRPLTDEDYFNHHADWHPDGQRIVFSSERRDTGFDLWEQHLPSGLAWRLTDHGGDETEPAWSANGQDLAYIRNTGEEWRLVLRRHGQAEIDLVISDTPLAAPSWRPDGSLLTFLRKGIEAYELQMVILSNPPLVRILVSGEDFFLSPASWLDRQHFYYTANGTIKSRQFNEWTSRPVMFRAQVGHAPVRTAAPAARELPVVDPSGQRLIIRTRRLYDGESPGYRENFEVVIVDGRIEAVQPQSGASNDAAILDLGDATMLPGFIDVYAQSPDVHQPATGLRLLSYGITTLVATDVPPDFDAELWESAEQPGPRLLRAVPVGLPPAEGTSGHPALLTIPATGLPPAVAHDSLQSWRAQGLPILAESWNVGLLLGADLLLGAEHIPASPLGRRYADMAIAAGNGPVTLVSGLADAETPGLSQLQESRQAVLAAQPESRPRRFSSVPDMTSATSTVVVGSKPNGLPPGMALHAELRALAAAGLDGDQVLNAVGSNAASALGLQGDLGRIAAGGLADLVIVAGDPRARISDALEVVAVVRNGRFYSQVSLLERAQARTVVE